jgi:diguanylate cyclase (GGDEF)-like protein
VARIGGDEFMVLLADLELNGDGAGNHPFRRPDLVAERVRRALQEPYVAAGVELHMSVSLGVGVFPIDCADKHELLRRADEAMYRAKELRGGGHVLLAGNDQRISDLAGGLREPVEIPEGTLSQVALDEGLVR